MTTLRAIFFDLGGTLGTPVVSDTGDLDRIDLLDSTITVLEEVKGKKIPTGIISNTGTIRGPKMNALLQAAGILNYFDPTLLIYSADVGTDKSSTKIFALAAHRARQPEQNCLFVGEDAGERKVAASAGFAVVAEPSRVKDFFNTRSLL